MNSLIAGLNLKRLVAHVARMGFDAALVSFTFLLASMRLSLAPARLGLAHFQRSTIYNPP